MDENPIILAVETFFIWASWSHSTEASLLLRTTKSAAKKLLDS